MTATDGSLDRRRAAVIFALVYVAFSASYLAVNFHSVGRPAAELWLPGEQSIPFVPEFEFIYATGYLFPLLLVLAVPDVARFRRAAISVPIVLGVAYTTYLLFPVYLERPVFEVDSVATWLLALEYRDPSYNHFPSLHVAFTWLVVLALWTGSRRDHTLVVLALAITVSTLFVKQHYLVDVVCGAALAYAAWWAAGRVGR